MLPSSSSTWRKHMLSVLVLSAAAQYTQGFVASVKDSCSSFRSFDSALFLAKSRKARRMQTQEVAKGRPQAFFDAIDDANDKPVATKTKKKKRRQEISDPPDDDDEEETVQEKRAREAQERMDARPEVSTMIVDEETGIEVIAQGKSVMDVVTRKAVVLSNLGPEYRLAQMFPGVPPDVREKHRLDWNTVSAEEAVEKLREACSVNGSIPPHPSVANKALDFVLANRDRLSYKMKRTLGRVTMGAASQGNTEQSLENQKLWKNFLTIENHISAPFRQMIMDAEGRVGPNFGNLDIMAFCNGELYERAANYLVLKGMVAHWEKKVIDADYIEKTPKGKENYMSILARGDPKRYLPDPPILFTLKECTQVCYRSQQMTQAFVETPELFNDLPPELRFMEQALTIKGGTALRQFMVEEFCPAEGITPEGLREGLRRLFAQLENMQIDPYADICNILERLINAVSVGTDDERDPYLEVLANPKRKGPGSFQTYTFNHDQLSLVRFFDGMYERSSIPSAKPAAGLGDLFSFGGNTAPADTSSNTSPSKSGGEFYKVPEQRASGRPHELGWLDALLEDDDYDKSGMFGKIPAGEIIPGE